MRGFLAIQTLSFQRRTFVDFLALLADDLVVWKVEETWPALLLLILVSKADEFENV